MISVDQLISPTPGLIAQMLGKPTNIRYMGAMVYVDHQSDYTYIHLQMTLDATETIKGKKYFCKIS